MTAPSIISHREAREIVGRLDGHAVAGINTARGTHWGNFAADGRITATLAEEARESEARRAAEPWQRDGEPDALWERLELFWALWAYVSHYGERGPVEAGYLVTVTPGGDVLPGDVWEWSQGYGGGEKTVREIDRDRAVFTDGMCAPLAAMLKESGIWKLKSRKPVSRQEVATLDDSRGADGQLVDGARTLAHRAVIEAWGGEGREDISAAETEQRYQAANVTESGGEFRCPDGSSITVEKTEGWEGL